MFTGIIGHLGRISSLETAPSGGILTVHAPTLAGKLAISNSIAVNGCCLTIVHHDHDHFSADLSPETLAKTAFRERKPGTRVNLEPPLTAGQEFGGHFVLGHVDAIGTVVHMNADGQSWNFAVEVPAGFARYLVSKGSITIDGISLTVARWHQPIAEIAVIPYTYSHTNLADCTPGDPVNLEADILGKYIEHYLAQRQPSSSAAALRLDHLVSQGF